MACGGFRFLLLTFQYLVGWGLINLVIRMNLVRLVHIVSQRLMRLWRKNYQRRSGAVRHVEDGAECDSAEHDSVRRHLAAIRYTPGE